MKRLILVLLALFVWHGMHVCAYDFIGVGREAGSSTLHYYYCNITSEDNAELPTCEITYSDKVEIDGVTVYNQKHEFGGPEYIPDKLIHEGIEYLVTGIGDHAFQDLPDDTPEGIALGHFTALGTSIKYIGKEAFKNWGSPYWLWILGADEIGEGAFENCSRLTFVEFPDKNVVKNKCHISSRAFHGCNQLYWFCVNAMPPSLFDIEKGAFDVVDGEIGCYLITIEDDELFSLYENEKVEPWTLFSGIFALEMRPSGPLGVETIYDDKDENERKYDLQGRPLQGDPDGIYIYKGKKYIDKH